MDLEHLNKISEQILRSAYKVHTALGPGLLEKAYEECLCYELIQAGYKAEKQKPLPLVYSNIKLEVGYKVDLFVENCVIVELKTVEKPTDVHKAQLLTYLRLSDGIKRIVNKILQSFSEVPQSYTLFFLKKLCVPLCVLRVLCDKKHPSYSGNSAPTGQSIPMFPVNHTSVIFLLFVGTLLSAEYQVEVINEIVFS